MDAIPEVKLSPLNRLTWEAATELRPKPEQEAFQPGVLHSIAQSAFERGERYGIWYRGKLVGFLLTTHAGGICWVSRLLVDQDFQGQGIGAAALRQIVADLDRHPGCMEIRAGISRDNVAALYLFLKSGFQKIGEEGPEIILKYAPD